MCICIYIYIYIYVHTPHVNAEGGSTLESCLFHRPRSRVSAASAKAKIAIVQAELVRIEQQIGGCQEELEEDACEGKAGHQPLLAGTVSRFTKDGCS